MTDNRKSDRGATAVVFAIAVSAMLAVAALVLGGSRGYSAVREAQNASDAAALAATSVLRNVQQGDAPSSRVLATAVSVAEANGATSGSVECDVVTATYALTHAESEVVGGCDGSNEFAVDAAGVRVRTTETKDVPFSAFVDQETIRAGAVAAATIQPVLEGRAPFMVCTSPDATGHPAQALLPDASDPTGYSVNPAAIGLSYVLHGNAMKDGGRQCGGGSASWRGFVSFSGSFPIPSPDPNDESDWWEVKTGNANGHLSRVLTGDDACEGNVDDIIGCRLALPLCPKSNGGTGVGLKLYCVKLGAFVITYNQHSSGTPPCNDGNGANGLVCGTFVGAANASSGQGGASTPDPDSVVVIKLVQ
ncbi:pilus assembly protein TadG-related protein [Actinospongicola halichondriae]|uniref:pilus assembly protein TadG-related protein n=1 Tax=Actinospongicola halichondriae TaxID=3236844 RepID=UPI003D3DF19D